MMRCMNSIRLLLLLKIIPWAPMRVLFEALGAIVNWEPDTRTAVGVRGGLVVRFPIDSDKATVKGVEKSMDAGTTYWQLHLYSLRFVTEALGMLYHGISQPKRFL